MEAVLVSGWIIGVVFLFFIAILAVLLPFMVWRIKVNTDQMARDLKRLADEAQRSLRRSS